MLYRRTQARPDVTGFTDGFPGQRHYTLGERLPVNDGAFNRIGSTDVLHQDANVRRAPAVRNLLAGQNLRQLFCAAGWIFSRDNPQVNIMLARQHRTHHRDSLRFIIFNADKYLLWLQDMDENLNAIKDLRCAILHQPIVSGDIRFALSGIDNQGVNFIATAAQFCARREACAA